MKSLFLKICILSLITGLFDLTQLLKADVNPAVLKAQQQRIEVVKKVAPSVVAVFGQTGGGGGSGVLISPDGYALTNFHVTNGAGDWMRCGLNDGKLYDAVIVSIDPTGDVALIKLLGRNDFPVSKLGDSDKLQIGDWAYAMGNPFLLATDFQPTITYGIISGVHRYQYPAGTFLEYTDCIQIDTSINPGNSGGPLFNAAGELVGINGRGSFEKRGRVNSGAGYAISINQIKHFMGHLKSGRILDHATLGASVSTETNGAIVIGGILEESEAYRRGLRIDDEIITFAGRSIRSVNQYKNILGIYPAGWKLPIVYRHDNDRFETYVRLRTLHRKSELTGKKKKKKKPAQPQPKKGDNKKPQPKKIPAKPKPKAPEKYKHMLIKKEGYANYYFNQLQQDRLIKSLATLGNYSQFKGTWALYGQSLPDDNKQKPLPIEFTLSDKGIGLELADKSYFQILGEDVTYEDEPRGSGGLLTAMHHLRLLLNQGKRPFTQFYYLGTEPLDGKGELVDVLATTLSTVKIHWYFSTTNGTLQGFDTWLEKDAEECSIRFLKFSEFEGLRFPNEIEIYHAGRKAYQFKIDKLKLKK